MQIAYRIGNTDALFGDHQPAGDRHGVSVFRSGEGARSIGDGLCGGGQLARYFVRGGVGRAVLTTELEVLTLVEVLA